MRCKACRALRAAARSVCAANTVCVSIELVASTISNECRPLPLPDAAGRWLLNGKKWSRHQVVHLSHTQHVRAPLPSPSDLGHRDSWDPGHQNDFPLRRLGEASAQNAARDSVERNVLNCTNHQGNPLPPSSHRVEYRRRRHLAEDMLGTVHDCKISGFPALLAVARPLHTSAPPLISTRGPPTP